MSLTKQQIRSIILGLFSPFVVLTVFAVLGRKLVPVVAFPGPDDPPATFVIRALWAYLAPASPMLISVAIGFIPLARGFRLHALLIAGAYFPLMVYALVYYGLFLAAFLYGSTL